MLNISEYCNELIHAAKEGTSVDLQQLKDCLPKSYGSVATVFVGLTLGLLTLLTAGGNMLIVLAVLMVRRLRTPANLLILNLALSDFLVSVLVLPLAIVYQVKGYWPFSTSACDMYIVLDVLLCTASILSLCSISVDRYLAITRPLTYAVNRTTKQMVYMIVICWLLAGLISLPPVFIFSRPDQVLSCGYSENLAYQVYATFVAFYLPLFVMLILYGRIYFIVRQLSIKDAKLSERLSIITLEIQKNSISEDAQHYVIPSNRMSTCQQTSKRPQPEKSTSLDSSGTQKSSLPACDEVDTDAVLRPPTEQSVLDVRPASEGNHRNSSLAHFLKNNLHISSTSHDRSAACRKSHSTASENMKAVITLGVIMGTFTMCWLPFFICQIINPILNVNNINLMDVIPLPLFQVFLWLGYMNSLFNPLIYAKFNQDFRRPFLYILKCQCRNINQRIRRRSFITQFQSQDAQGARQSEELIGLTKQRPSRRPTHFHDSVLTPVD